MIRKTILADAIAAAAAGAGLIWIPHEML